MSSPSERATRRRWIDPKLAAAGWSVVPAGTPDSCAPAAAVADAHVYLGSKRHMMERIFSDENEPLWRSAKRMEWT